MFDCFTSIEINGGSSKITFLLENTKTSFDFVLPQSLLVPHFYSHLSLYSIKTFYHLYISDPF